MPVEVIDALNCESGKVYVDCTVGGAGHSKLIAEKIKPDGTLICLDVDNDAIEEATKKLNEFANVQLFRANHLNLPELMLQAGIDKINGGVLIDLGASYHQLTSTDKGFSFQHSSKLDMRMDQSLTETAEDLVNSLSADELSEIFWKYGEEKYSRRIASAISTYSEKERITDTLQLAEIVKSVVPKSRNFKIHPATRVFQALRIAVNKELEVLQQSLANLLELTAPGARIVVITFHSLEDRIVKNFFKHWALDCICPPTFIECRCEHEKKLKIITKKPIIPGDDELKNNPAARSSKLRIVERL
jgi:16S rRNA (cytosine1402-N4)-methyltransferase